MTVGLSFYWQLFRHANLVRLLPSEEALGAAVPLLSVASPVTMFYFAAFIVAVAAIASDTVRECLAQPRIACAAGLAASAVCAAMIIVQNAGARWSGVCMLLGIAALLAMAYVFVALAIAWTRHCSLAAVQDRKGFVCVVCASSLLSLIVSSVFSIQAIEATLLVAVSPGCSGLLLMRSLSRGGTSPRRRIVEPFAPRGVVGALVVFLVLIVCTKGFSDVCYSSGTRELLYLKHFITAMILIAIIAICLFSVSMSHFAFIGWAVLTLGVLVGFAMIFTYPSSPTALELALGIIAGAKTCLELFLFILVAGVLPERAARLSLLLIVLPETTAYIVGCGVMPVFMSTTALPAATWLAALSTIAGIVVVAATFIVMWALALRGISATAPDAPDPSTTFSDNENEALSVGSTEEVALPFAYGINEHNAQLRFERVCEQYGLTKRERETVALFFRGYSAKRIAEIHYVSLNTAQSHIRSAYRKLGVHNRQELIDVIMASRA